MKLQALYTQPVNTTPKINVISLHSKANQLWGINKLNPVYIHLKKLLSANSHPEALSKYITADRQQSNS